MRTVNSDKQEQIERGKRIKNIRENELHLNKAQLARLLGVSGQFLGLVEEGKGNYTISGLSARPYTVTAYCRGDENYLISNSSAHFTVNKKNTPIDVVVTNATVGSIEFITVTVDTNASGNILLNINGSTYYSVIEKGVAKFNVTGLLVGNYTAVVTYEGDDCFNTNTTNASIKTEKITTLIHI